MKRILSAVLSVVLVLGMIPAALAASGEHQKAADNLYQLGLVSGTGTDANGNPIYELDRAPTRSEAITVLVKLLGKADEASVGEWKTPFTDVPGWAQNFVGYAYANGLTSGTSATTFGGDDLVTAAQYITFVLKALGYSANGDFQWDKAWELSDRLGITGGRYNADTKIFLRGDVFAISEAALKIKLKNSGQTLAEKLIGAGTFTGEQYARVYGANPAVPGEKLTTQQISEKCAPAVFYIESYGVNGGIMGSGSGFFIAENGLAITNRHVVENAYYLKVRTPDGKTYTDVRVLDGDIQNDLALLWVAGEGFRYLEQGDSDTLKQGQQVYAFGCPIGLENTMSQGIVANPRRVLSDTEYVQISVPIDHGSSGGALVDEWGRVVGVTSGGFESTADLNLAIPINAADGLERNWDDDLLLMASEDCYNGFEYVLDFGLVCNVEELVCLETALGWLFTYDMDDFYPINGKGAAEVYAETLDFYTKLLIGNGMKLYTNETEGTAFEIFLINGEEFVHILPDYEERLIYMKVVWIPVDYKAFNGILDFGWMTGLELGATYDEDDGSTTYGYIWDDDYTAKRIKELVELYAEYMIDEQDYWLYRKGEDERGYYWSLVSHDNKKEVFISLDNDGYLFININ